MHYSILKGFKYLNKVCERGTIILSIEGIKNGYLFRKKNAIEKGKGLDLGAESPRLKAPLPGYM